MHIHDVLTPAAVVDLEQVERNIASMAEFATKNEVNLRPHVKTHKCSEIARIQKKHGCNGITVATLGEALAFAEAGFDDLTLAKPFVLGKEKEAINLAKKVSLNLLVDHPQTVERLQKAAREEQMTLKVLLKVDCGYHRCGVDPSRPESIRVAESIEKADNLVFEGILTHGGHSYGAMASSEIQRIAKKEQDVMIRFARDLGKAGHDLRPRTVSIGSTPTMTQSREIEDGITEMRPGNYVFFDYTQAILGSCDINDIALSVMSTIIGVYEGRVVIDAGATALSKDQGPVHVDPECGYGKVIESYEKSELDDKASIQSLSQEHGKIRLQEGSVLQSLEPGSKIRIVPNHSCLVANLFNHYLVSEKGEITQKWKIHRERLGDRPFHSEAYEC